MDALRQLWALDSPVFFILATLLVYRGALYLFARTNKHPLAHPLFIAPALIALGLTLAELSYADYLVKTEWLVWMLGPATVALAMPLYTVASGIRPDMSRVLLLTLVGASFSVFSAIAIAWALGADALTLGGLATKSVTTPIALAVSELIGSKAQLAATAVVITGVTGAISAPWLMPRIGINDERALGFTLGLTAHGIGTARAFDISQQCGAFASLGMSLTALLSAVCLPLLF